MISSGNVPSKSPLMSPIISSVYGVNRDSRILDVFLYVVSKSNTLPWLLQSLLSPSYR